MKYKPEKDWLPKDTDLVSSRQLKRNRKMLIRKIEKKSTSFFKYIWVNSNDSTKEKIVNQYTTWFNNSLYKLICEYNMDSIIHDLKNNNIISENELKIIKRKYIIDKLTI